MLIVNGVFNTGDNGKHIIYFIDNKLTFYGLMLLIPKSVVRSKMNPRFDKQIDFD